MRTTRCSPGGCRAATGTATTRRFNWSAARTAGPGIAGAAVPGGPGLQARGGPAHRGPHPAAGRHRGATARLGGRAGPLGGHSGAGRRAGPDAVGAGVLGGADARLSRPPGQDHPADAPGASWPPRLVGAERGLLGGPRLSVPEPPRPTPGSAASPADRGWRGRPLQPAPQPVALVGRGGGWLLVPVGRRRADRAAALGRGWARTTGDHRSCCGSGGGRPAQGRRAGSRTDHALERCTTGACSLRVVGRPGTWALPLGIRRGRVGRADAWPSWSSR